MGERKLIQSILTDLLHVRNSSTDDYQEVFYRPCLQGVELINSKHKREDARKVLDQNLELVFALLLTGL